jgi:hypothetical protein
MGFAAGITTIPSIVVYTVAPVPVKVRDAIAVPLVGTPVIPLTATNVSSGGASSGRLSSDGTTRMGIRVLYLRGKLFLTS